MAADAGQPSPGSGRLQQEGPGFGKREGPFFCYAEQQFLPSCHHCSAQASLKQTWGALGQGFARGSPKVLWAWGQWQLEGPTAVWVA